MVAVAGENVVVAEASRQILGYWKFYHLKITVLTSLVEKSVMELPGCLFLRISEKPAKNLQVGRPRILRSLIHMYV